MSNFLFSKEANAVLSIIDIDTIMPGMILYDFADMVRSFANKSKEDSTIRGKSFDSNIYEALKNGYLSIGKQFMMMNCQHTCNVLFELIYSLTFGFKPNNLDHVVISPVIIISVDNRSVFNIIFVCVLLAKTCATTRSEKIDFVRNRWAMFPAPPPSR